MSRPRDVAAMYLLEVFGRPPLVQDHVAYQANAGPAGLTPADMRRHAVELVPRQSYVPEDAPRRRCLRVHMFGLRFVFCVDAFSFLAAFAFFLFCFPFQTPREV